MKNPQYFPELDALSGVPFHVHEGGGSGGESDPNKVDKTTTVNGKPLSSNITLTKTDIGLSNVDNTADNAKPISTLTQAQLDLKAPLASPAFTGTPTGITKTHVGLSNVDNTTDIGKPISTATQTALNLKANAASPTFTGTVTGITKAHVGLSNVDNTSDVNKPVSTAVTTKLLDYVSNVTDTFGVNKILNIVSLTEAEYTALVTKDVNTLYVTI